MNGTAVCYFAFDVANETTLERVGEIASGTPKPLPRPFGRGTPRGLGFDAPLEVQIPGPVTGLGPTSQVFVHVYSVGVVSIAIHFPFRGESLAGLRRFHDPRLADGSSAADFAAGLCTRVVDDIADALIRPTPPADAEGYTVFLIADGLGTTTTADWLAAHSREVTGLLADLDADRVSDSQVAEVLKQHRSLQRTDLVVIDWDAALVIEPDSAAEDVLFAIELANLQLGEFRQMDRTLDAYLNRAYGDLESRPVRLFGISTSVLRKLRRFRVDVAKLADEVTNITKFFGDWYLARVYMAAHERFHLDQWRASVESRLTQLDRLYSVLHSDLNERRMYWLELIIVVFFAIDIFALFWLRR